MKRYVARQSKFVELENWVLSRYQQILDSGDERAIQLAIELNALFVERGEDVITEEEFQYELESLVSSEESSKTFSIGEPIVRSSSDRSVRKHINIPGQIVTVRQELLVS